MSPGAVGGERASLPLCALALACTAPGERDGFVNGIELKSKHFAYYAAHGDPDVCTESVQAAEEHYTALQALLGFPDPHAPIKYFKFRNWSEYSRASGCAAYHSSCGRSGAVWTTTLVDGHNLTHAYLSRVGEPPDLFAEGLATLVSCSYAPWSADERDGLRSITWRSLAAWSIPSPLDYAAAAQFARHLVETYGWPRILDFYRQAYRTSVPDRVNSQFSEAFGTTIGDAWQAAVEMDLPGGICLMPRECAAAALPLDGNPFSVGDRCGVTSEERSLTLEQHGAVAIQFVGRSLLWLSSCDGTVRTPPYSVRAQKDLGVALVTALPAGKYFVGHGEGAVTARHSTLTAVGGPAPLSQSCADALKAPVAFDPATVGEIHSWVPRSGGTWFLGISPTATRTFDVFAESDEKLSICESCDPSVSCLPVGFARTIALDRPVTLRLATTPADGFTEVLVLRVD